MNAQIYKWLAIDILAFRTPRMKTTPTKKLPHPKNEANPTQKIKTISPKKKTTPTKKNKRSHL